MIIFLYGPDDWRREQRKKFYIGEFKKKYSGLSMEYFDLANTDALENLEVFLRGQSLFVEKKLAVIENLYEAIPAGSSQAYEKKIAKVVHLVVAKKTIVRGGSDRELGSDSAAAKKATSGEVTDEAVILFSEAKKPPKTLAFLLEKPAKVEVFENLAGPAWSAFVKKSAEELGVKLEYEALRFLSEVYQNNTWGLMTELEKLANFDKEVSPQILRGIVPEKRISSGSVISREDLEALGLEALPNYWTMIQSAKSQNLKTRLWALERLFAQKEPPAKLFNILASTWQEKTPQMAEQDFMVKSGKLEYEEALLELVL